MKNLIEAFKELPRNLLFQSILVILCMIPLIETIGQFIISGYIERKTSVLILFWPGVKFAISIPMRLWIPIGIISLLYILGLLYMIRKKTLGEVLIIGVVGGILIANGLAFCVNHLTGWAELQRQSSSYSSGITINPDNLNIDIFYSCWHNPVWEEIVFRGIPLFILMLVKNKLSAKAYIYSEVLYILLPSIIFVVYHLPNHGPSRIIDTFIFGCICAYLALKYTFFAPLVIHCITNSQGILTIVNRINIPKNQVAWLSQNYYLFSNINNITIACLILSIPLILIWKIKNIKKTQGVFHSFTET